MVDTSVVESVKKYLGLLRAEGLDVSFGVLFGSFARGEADKWSDIDLLVVSPRFDSAYGREDVDRLWIAVTKGDNRIEPIPCGERQWTEDNARAIVEVARREGLMIEAA